MVMRSTTRLSRVRDFVVRVGHITQKFRSLPSLPRAPSGMTSAIEPLGGI